MIMGDDVNTHLNEIVQKLKEKFAPASNLDESDFAFTTNELEAAILQLDPDIELSENSLFTAMKEYGYTYEPVVENEKVQFKWLFKES